MLRLMKLGMLRLMLELMLGLVVLGLMRLGILRLMLELMLGLLVLGLLKLGLRLVGLMKLRLYRSWRWLWHWSSWLWH